MNWQTKADYLAIGAWLILAATVDWLGDTLAGWLCN